MRRTGGTSFANIIEHIISSKIEHEPFNWDRTFGFITKNFKNNKENFKNLEQQLNEHCISNKVCIKHCYEIVGQVLNESLIELFAQTNYKHIILLRKNELLRLVSLYTAQQTNVWGKHGSEKTYEAYRAGELKLSNYDVDEMKSHFQYCHKVTELIKLKMSKCNVDFLELYYEDLYSGTFAERKQYLTQACRYLNIDEEIIEQNSDNFRHWLMRAKQNSNTS